ncbi:MAG: LLM class flavin-dependent oxidoreductase [Gammaproteobacteria bacterium]|nr:LLM class flavin-dependent oxidoreductase [Gammaproteobacteria bacterium]
MALSANRFQLAVFGSNVSHGCTISEAAGGIEVNWAESLRIARTADALGLEAVIPVCRWKGFGGPSQFNHRSFETWTWAAGLAQATTHIHVFATTAVPSIHPVLAAKQAVTIDHISGGRFGLNVVSGWNSQEVAMFGKTQYPHAERYALTDEWMTLITALWTHLGEFDFAGQYFTAPRCYAEPKPLQHPRPPVMSAGVSPAGRRFAAKHADMNFILAPNLAMARATVADVRRIAREDYQREVEVWGNAAIFCAPTHAEAQDYYRHVIHERGDLLAAGNLLDTFTAESGSQLPDPALREAYLRNMMAGYSGFPVVGTPSEVTDFLQAMAECGLAGATLSWPDYEAGLAQLGTSILPLLEERGLRTAPSVGR